MENLASFLMRMNNYPEALELYIKLNYLEPTESKYWYYIAECYLNLPAIDPSRKWAQKFME